MKKYPFIWFLIMFVSYTNTFAADKPNKEVLLQQLASSKQDTGRLSILAQLIKITHFTPEEQTGYVDMLLKEAEEQGNNYHKCQAYLQYMILAYNRYDSEEVNKWMKLLEPVARKAKLYDDLFRAKQCVIDMLLINEQYELEEKEAKLMLKEAQELNNLIGQISAYHSLAHVYGRTYRPDEAFEVLEKAIELGGRCSNQFLYGEVIRTMTLMSEEARDYPRWQKHLRMQDSLIICLEKQFPNESFKGDRMLNAIFWLRYHTKLKEWDKIQQDLQNIDQNYSDQYATAYKQYYFGSKCYYYSTIKDWDKALMAANELLKLLESTSEVEYANRLFMKAWILCQMGQDKEALGFYKQVKQLQDSLSVSTINKQAEQLKNSYKADLQVLSQAAHQQQIHLIFLILSGIVMAILIASIIHTNRVKRKLTRAEKVMRAMMDETEQANKVKERFLSNINMTIRPPLDIMVASSGRLASEEFISQTEKEHLSALINQTSTDLMELINDILLLSKLEAKMMRFNTREVELVQFMKDLGEAISQRNPEKISMDIPDHLPECKIQGDENYLKQVINSLCSTTNTKNDIICVKLEKNNGTGLNIRFINTGLALSNPNQGITIRNEINRMITEYFGGEYHIQPSSSEPSVLLTFNTQEQNQKNGQ